MGERRDNAEPTKGQHTGHSSYGIWEEEVKAQLAILDLPTVQH